MIYKVEQLEFSKVIIRENDDGSTTSFGENVENPDYRQYLAWLEKGNVPEVLE